MEDFMYIASEESAIREVCPSPEYIYRAEGGEPIIGRLRAGSGKREAVER